MTKSSKLLFNKLWLWTLAVLASLNLLFVVCGIVYCIGIVSLLFQAKDGITQLGETYTQTGVIDLQPLPIAASLRVSDQLLWLKRWDVLEKSSALLALLHQLQTTDQRMLLIFQGPEELRPTGGFMGAYGIATFHNGRLVELTFEDIYDAAGQMKTKFEPPPGVAEYTSGGEGWKLPDANWDPDFPTSVNTVRAMMQDAGKGEFTGVIVVNTTVLKELLSITGPVNLPEYQTELSVETLDDLLNAHRKEFFAGSRAKVTMLQQSFNKMLYALAALTPKQQLSAAKLLLDALQKKSVQIWHSDPQVQDRLIKAHSAGSMPTTAYIALIEANVGINKINDAISRTIVVSRSNDRLHMQVEWRNNAEESIAIIEPVALNPDRKPFVKPAPEADHNAYVNYLRVQTSAEIQIASGSATELIIVQPGQTVRREYSFTVPPGKKVMLWKQSGIDQTLIRVERSLGHNSRLLMGDTLIF